MKMKFHKEVVLGAITAFSIVVTPLAYGAAFLSETATVTGVSGKLFDIDSNAAGLTAQERASIIQKNLEYAIIHAHNRTPLAVRILVVNRNPVVTLDGYHIITADGNSATRHRVSQLQLAEEWAHNLRLMLTDAVALDRYIAMLTGNYPAMVAAPPRELVAYARAGLYMPVTLATPIDSECVQLGTPVEAVLSCDVPLPTSQSSTQYEAYLPAGTVAQGLVTDATNKYLGHCAVGVRFDRLRTPSGEIIPINAHILGGVGTWVNYNNDPRYAEFGTIGGRKLSPCHGMLAQKGSICGGWRGYPIGADLEIPYQKLVFKRGTGIAVAPGEPMLLQLAAPTAIAVTTNSSDEHVSRSVNVAIGGAGSL